MTVGQVSFLNASISAASIAEKLRGMKCFSAPPLYHDIRAVRAEHWYLGDPSGLGKDKLWVCLADGPPGARQCEVCGSGLLVRCPDACGFGCGLALTVDWLGLWVGLGCGLVGVVGWLGLWIGLGCGLVCRHA